MTNPTEVAKIAGGLTKAQREALATNPERVAGFVGALIGLCLDGLANLRPDNSVYLTPLGLAVRAHLQQKAETHD